MYKMVGLVLIMLLALLANNVHAETNEKYCYLMVTIYGACSPELIDNYLARIAPQVYHAPRVIPQVKLSLATVATVQNSTLPQTSLKTEPNVRYTWYWNNIRWVKGRLVA
jgi:hypothetical protein